MAMSTSSRVLGALGQNNDSLSTMTSADSVTPTLRNLVLMRRERMATCHRLKHQLYMLSICLARSTEVVAWRSASFHPMSAAG